MNYNKFYKQANRPYTGTAGRVMADAKTRANKYLQQTVDSDDSDASKETTSKNQVPKQNPSSAGTAGSKKGWSDEINGIQGYQSHLPILALLAGAGALGGWAFSGKNKGRAGAIYGGMSLPALYLAYLYGRRNGWIGGNEANAFDSFSNEWINKPVNDLFTGDANKAAS